MKRNAHRKQSDEDSPFSVRLRQATQEVHSLAEQTGFIRGFLRGTASHESYLQLLLDLFPVYQEMEYQLDCLCAAKSERLLPFHFKELYRSSALTNDIRYLRACCLESGQGEHLEPSSHSLDYVRRVREVAVSDEPVRLIGHLYTRYLGDLSGGQILARIARNSMQLDDGQGLDFYRFESIANTAAMKTDFRAALDTIHGQTRLEQAVVDEAILSFRFNIDIFNALRGNSLVSLWKNFQSLFKQRSQIRSNA